MALIHKATLNPPKLQLLTSWLPTRPWFPGGTHLHQLGAYRFDDPNGAVGVEAFLLQAGDGPAVHVPLTYRGAPLKGADAFLVGTTEHSVLGTRWVYDGCGDPVWAATLATAILSGGSQAAELVDVDGRLEPRAPTATVVGSGTAETPTTPVDAVTCFDDGPTTIVRTNLLELVVVRVLGAEIAAGETLTGTWAGAQPAVLAGIRPI